MCPPPPSCVSIESVSSPQSRHCVWYRREQKKRKKDKTLPHPLASRSSPPAAQKPPPSASRSPRRPPRTTPSPFRRPQRPSRASPGRSRRPSWRPRRPPTPARRAAHARRRRAWLWPRRPSLCLSARSAAPRAFLCWASSASSREQTGDGGLLLRRDLSLPVPRGRWGHLRRRRRRRCRRGRSPGAAEAG